MSKTMREKNRSTSPPPSTPPLENVHTPAANKIQPKSYDLGLTKSLWAKIGNQDTIFDKGRTSQTKSL